MRLNTDLAKAVLYLTRGVFLARRHLARGTHAARRDVAADPSRRNILFVTVDQQRYDALGANGGRIARTRSLDALANGGLNYRRAHVQNVV